MKQAYVYYAPLPDSVGGNRLYPDERMREIEKCANERVRREKYWAWVLLEKALKDAFNLEINNLQFTKSDCGKWSCDHCHFSISHSDGILAVAVSGEPIGVDAERIRAQRDGIEGKILSDAELSHYLTLGADARTEYLISTWCKKEAIFKSQGEAALMPKTVQTQDKDVYTTHLHLASDEYILACTATPSRIVRISLSERS